VLCDSDVAADCELVGVRVQIVVMVLVVCVQRLVWDDKTNDFVLETRYYDFVCDDLETRKNDYHFVRAAWIKLVGLLVFDGIHRIRLFSDGASKHFKQRWFASAFDDTALSYGRRFTLSWFSAFKVNFGIDLEWSFFASNHGHGLADSHAATLKSKVDAAVRKEGGDRELLVQKMQKEEKRSSSSSATAPYKSTVGPTGAKELVDLWNANCKNTIAVCWRRSTVVLNSNRTSVLYPMCGPSIIFLSLRTTRSS
jgi:hypothetical protein